MSWTPSLSESVDRSPLNLLSGQTERLRYMTGPFGPQGRARKTTTLAEDASEQTERRKGSLGFKQVSCKS